ncbi:AMP-binding protein, partial [Amycolatopsis sp. NPDC004079]|uniref:AMP-binding protein n=1 Tax=Amycolatopsis sp. NPDC004079 TaxID=3154549 RepID=UPI0033AFFD0B
MERLPLTANGKVDRKQLRELLTAVLDSGAEAAAPEPPRGEVETTLAGLWAELLGIPEIGRQHNFFALGGDSLLATRLLARLRAAGIAGGTLAGLFETPVLADFASVLRPGESGPVAVLAADPEHRYEPFPGTDVQRAYWIGRTSELALGNVGSHWYWEFDGAGTDVARVEEAFNRLIARHEMLRAVFDENGRQRVLPEVPRFVIPVRHAGPDGDAALAELREEMSHRIADPERWPLVEIRAVRHGDRTRLAFSFDYIVLDALSVIIVFGELAALYHDLAAELPPVGVSFRDYVLRAGPAAGELETAQRYWSERVDRLPPAPGLPLAKDPSQVSKPRFVRRETWLPPHEWRALAGKAREHGLTPATVLAAAYAEVLAAWSGSGELTLNLTLFDRREVHPDINNILGDFTSLLLVSHRPAGTGERWLDVARRFQEQVWSDMEHSQVSAIWVLREMARRTGAAAVSMPVVFTSALGMPEDVVDLRFPFGEQVWGISQTPQVWLDHQVTERDGGLYVNWDAVDELFVDGVLDAMFDAYRGLLKWLVESDWAASVGSLLPAGHREVRAAVNATGAEVPDGLLQSGFFEWAVRDPSRIAVVWGDSDGASFGALAESALRIAGVLADRGVRSGDPVGVSVSRGVHQVAAVLGVLAAGGVYVPVGAEHPVERRSRIYRGAGIRVVLGERSAGAEWPDGIELVDVAEARKGVPLERPVGVGPDDLAYVIYTSGSTGVPKGVEV